MRVHEGQRVRREVEHLKRRITEEQRELLQSSNLLAFLEHYNASSTEYIKKCIINNPANANPLKQYVLGQLASYRLKWLNHNANEA